MCSTLLQGQKAVTWKYLRVTHLQKKHFNYIPRFRTYSHPPCCYMSVISLSDALWSVLWILTQFRDLFMQPYYYLPVTLLGVWCSSKCLVYIISVDHSDGWENWGSELEICVQVYTANKTLKPWYQHPVSTLLTCTTSWQTSNISWKLYCIDMCFC